MAEQRPERPTADGDVAAAEWAAFLEARVKEELETADAISSHGWWDLTEPGARRFGVRGMAGRVFAPIFTTSGHFLDQATAMHIVRNQPQRMRDDLMAKRGLGTRWTRSRSTASPRLRPRRWAVRTERLLSAGNSTEGAVVGGSVVPGV
ncbi:DUF6221 family protein [Streptomyces sp. NPDC017964]|uniref:DUF6221 family protein n=1 Tax=Streptomyces sp. NPDC017964 TaxID=3365022 RepID=UPI00378FC4E8